MEQRRREEFARPRLYVTGVGFFALISVALATVGLYGVLASGVQGRTREIGLRMALGAHREQLRRDVLRRGLVLSTLGLAFGVAGALALSPVLGAFLYDLPRPAPRGSHRLSDYGGWHPARRWPGVLPAGPAGNADRPTHGAAP